MSTDFTPRAERFPACDTPGSIAHQALRLIDLSDTGVRIATSVWLAPGRNYVLRIDDPPFQVSGRVAWAKLVGFDRERGNGALFEAGIEFDDPSPAARERLTQLMARFVLRAPAGPLPFIHAEAF